MNPAATCHARSFSRPGPTICRVIGIILLVFSLPELLISAYFGWRSYEEAQTWERATAVITEVEKRENHTGDTPYYYYPHFRFTAQDGQEYTLCTTMGSNPAPYEVGEAVEVLYPADNPKKAGINSFVNLYLFPLIFGCFGAMLTFAGVILLVVARCLRRRQTPPPLPPVP